MRSDIVPGAVFPDYELSDHTAKRRKLSELQGQDPMVLILSRGSYCPEDLKKFDVPTLILHGDDDQIVPIANSAMLSSKLVKGAILKVYPGAPHGMCSTSKDQINADLLAFFKAEPSSLSAKVV